jgi:hypothetical protein
LGGTRPQLEILASQKRFITIFASRRFGKTTLGCLRHIRRMGQPKLNGLCWWVAPTYRQARKPFNMLLSALLPTGLVVDKSRADLRIELATGWTWEGRSADRPDNLRGEGVDDLVVDEHAMISDETWHECLEPTLMDAEGSLLSIGTPRGRRGWGYENYRRGQSAMTAAEYESFKYTVYDAAFIPLKEVARAKRDMPKRAFDQELMAAFLDGVGTVFEDVRDRKLRPIFGEPLGIGVDWAKKRDWTWFVAVGAKSGAVWDCFRVPRLAYPKQVEQLKRFIERWSSKAEVVSVHHDKTGVGEALDDILAEAGIEATGLVFTNKSKADLIEEAVVDFESGRLGFIPGAEVADEIYEAMIREHEDFTLTVTKKGLITYGAPPGLHDDAVIATALANRARRGLWREYALTSPRVTFLDEEEIEEEEDTDDEEQLIVTAGQAYFRAA